MYESNSLFSNIIEIHTRILCIKMRFLNGNVSRIYELLFSLALHKAYNYESQVWLFSLLNIDNYYVNWL